MESQQMFNCVTDTKSKANYLIKYSLEEWRKDMLYLVSENWNVKPNEVTDIIDIVIKECKCSFEGIPQSYNYPYYSGILDSIRQQVRDMPTDNTEVARNALLAYMALNTAYRGSVDTVYKKYRSLWDDVTTKIVSLISRILIKPKDYYAALDMWKNDQPIVSPAVKFESIYDRGGDDLLFSPKAALSLRNLIYSQKEQGISLKRSLIGFMVRDMMEILSILQWHYHEIHLSAYPIRLDVTPRQFTLNRDCKEILKLSVADRDRTWFKDPTLNK